MISVEATPRPRNPRRGRIVGMDVVEVSPPLDHNRVTSKTASRRIIDFLTAIFEE
ncbi:MAG: arginase family protein [Acidimicrobiales bacterium]